MYLTSGFVYETAEVAEKSFKEEENRFMYSRFGNPTIEIFQNKLSLIEEAEVCWATASGMSSLFTILMSYLKAGDRVVAGRALFGSCHHILTKILPKFGIEVQLVDGKDLNEWELALKKKQKLFFLKHPQILV